MRITQIIILIACAAATVVAEPAPIIISGKVMMRDGTPPAKTVSIEKICSDSQSGTPGPATNKKGEYVWRIVIDNLDTTNCFLRVNVADFSSTQVSISGLNGHTTTTVTVEPIIMYPKVTDPLEISVDEGAIPGKSRAAWKAAMAAASKDVKSGLEPMKQVVQDSPKFVQGWYGLGVFQYLLRENDDARKSMEQAIALDPKFIQAYVVLERIAVRQQDWAGAAKASEAGIAQDKKSTYPEQYLHLAVAKYQTKDMAGAEAAVHEALNAKNAGKVPRAEYVMGRIMLAKGDVAGGREHMTAYLKSDPDTADKAEIQAFMATMDKPGGKEPDLEVVQ